MRKKEVITLGPLDEPAGNKRLSTGRSGAKTAAESRLLQKIFGRFGEPETSPVGRGVPKKSLDKERGGSGQSLHSKEMQNRRRRVSVLKVVSLPPHSRRTDQKMED